VYALLRRGIGVEAGVVDGHDVDRLAGSGFAETWAVIEQALERERNVRVGLEDTLALPDGRPARGNADLVRAAVRVAEGLGRLVEPAAPL
jgi:uncharacterized protein (DUF849 family)